MTAPQHRSGLLSGLRLRSGLRSGLRAGLALAAGVAALGAGVAYADNDCEARVADWKPRSALVKMAEDKGWQVDAIRVDDGCYAVIGVDAQGKFFRAKIDPATLDVVSMRERRGGERRHGRRMRDGDEDGPRGWRGGEEGGPRGWRGGRGRDEGSGWRGGDEERRREGRRHGRHDDDDGESRDSRSGDAPAQPPSMSAPTTAPPSAPAPDGQSLIGPPKAEIR
jgi:hypothetical protein